MVVSPGCSRSADQKQPGVPGRDRLTGQKILLRREGVKYRRNTELKSHGREKGQGQKVLERQRPVTRKKVPLARTVITSLDLRGRSKGSHPSSCGCIMRMQFSRISIMWHMGTICEHGGRRDPKPGQDVFRWELPPNTSKESPKEEGNGGIERGEPGDLRREALGLLGPNGAGKTTPRHRSNQLQILRFVQNDIPSWQHAILVRCHPDDMSSRAKRRICFSPRVAKRPVLAKLESACDRIRRGQGLKTRGS